MPTPNTPFVLILAGGSGERFWPLSRRARPKQLLKLLSENSLLEDTINRLDGFVPRERILILTNEDQEAAVRAMFPGLPSENIVAEPAKRDTAAAIALAVGWVARRDSGATMLVLPADHVIRDTAAFQRDLAAAARAAEQAGALVTIGIKPTWACPGFGYIELGEPVREEPATSGTATVFNVPAVPRKARPGTRAGVFRQRQLPLERRDVRLDAARRAAGTQRADSRPGRLRFADSQCQGFRRDARGKISASAKDFHRLCHHGKRRAGPRARSRVRLGRRGQLDRRRGLSAQGRARKRRQLRVDDPRRPRETSSSATARAPSRCWASAT